MSTPDRIYAIVSLRASGPDGTKPSIILKLKDLPSGGFNIAISPSDNTVSQNDIGLVEGGSFIGNHADADRYLRRLVNAKALATLDERTEEVTVTWRKTDGLLGAQFYDAGAGKHKWYDIMVPSDRRVDRLTRAMSREVESRVKVEENTHD